MFTKKLVIYEIFSKSIAKTLSGPKLNQKIVKMYKVNTFFQLK